jgi:N-acetyl-anhydromuramyl-L-alanine amidase AmpD
MATTLKTLRWGDLAVGITIFVLAALTGCSSPQASSSSRKSTVAMSSAPTFNQLPAPSFDGPNIVASAPAAAAAPTAKAQANVAAPSGSAAWKPRVPSRDWKWIVIHHSATPGGSMAFFDKEHKAKGWDGVGYHFVIGNGTESGDGQIEVTQRWPLQKWGAHAKTVDNRFNEHGIGICLVGNFDVERPSPKQMQSLARLVAHLSQTYRISPQNVVGHKDTKATDCPGRFVNMAAIRNAAGATADADIATDVNATAAIESAPEQTAQTAVGELLIEVAH